MAWRTPTASTKARGYGSAHTKARAAAAKVHREDDPCVRCGHPLGPMGPWLHYDHNNQRTGYLGFSHGSRCPWCGKRCNVKAGASKGARVANYRRKIRKLITTADRW